MGAPGYVYPGLPTRQTTPGRLRRRQSVYAKASSGQELWRTGSLQQEFTPSAHRAHPEWRPLGRCIEGLQFH